MRQMFATIREIQADRRGGNPFLRILGVVPTLYTRQWREHRDFLQQMAEVCEEERVRLFPPVARRQSYLYLSMHGQDYRPIADALERATVRLKVHSVGDHWSRSNAMKRLP